VARSNQRKGQREYITEILCPIANFALAFGAAIREPAAVRKRVSSTEVRKSLICIWPV